VQLSPEQQQIVDHRGTDLQVIACAGAGKTESMARRVASLLAEGEDPSSIVAFTFTKRAASELAHRIEQRLVEVLGESARDRMAALYVGTIHAFCQRLLQTHVPALGDYDVIDENEHTALLSREFRALGLAELSRGHWRAVADFAEALDVMGNELISDEALSGSALEEPVRRYRATLCRYRLLTFSELIARAVRLLRDPRQSGAVRGVLKHLLVDEYQDINPAQEELIRLLAEPPVQLTVVGDDDQAIYQWRGADVANILTFQERRAPVTSVHLLANRRSRAPIVEAANAFALDIPDRLDKAMTPVRPGGDADVVGWGAPTDVDEATSLADHMLRLHDAGFAWREIAVLYRSVRTAAGPLLDALEERGIPYQCAGRTGLFLRTEIRLLGELYAWFVDADWQEGRWGEPQPAEVEDVARGLRRLFPHARPDLQQYLEDWRAVRLRGRALESMVADLYRLYDELGVWRLDPDNPKDASHLGALAQFAKVLGDFEHIFRRGHTEEGSDGRTVFRPGPNRGKSLYRSLHNFLLHWAQGAYEDFTGEPATDLDAVDVLTVHQAKGLEWPVVFLPSLVTGRFPSRRAGTPRDWLLPTSAVSEQVARRYAGGDAEERRLFYVALTRARDTVYLSRFAKKANRFKPSPYLLETVGDKLLTAPGLPVPDRQSRQRSSTLPPLDISFSSLALAADCGQAWRLGTSFDFPQPHAPQLGYGRALHHVLRQLAERTRTTGRIPKGSVLNRLLEREFYVPYATPAAWRAMRSAAKRAVTTYVRDHADELSHIWGVERPFELHLSDGVVRGRADVVVESGPGPSPALSVLDYKVSTAPEREASYAWQLQVYASAGRREGLDIQSAWLHELSTGSREPVDLTPEVIADAEARVSEVMEELKEGRLVAAPSSRRCGKCDWRPVCGRAAGRAT
jgi:DNA helicase II / ATP-dependent DNA helicase PcrA